jgi:hypothetical protein
MNIRVSNSEGVVENKHYNDIIKVEERDKANDDVQKLLSLKRDLMVKPAEMELIALCKSNQLMRKTIQKVKGICQSTESAKAKLQKISALLENH